MRTRALILVLAASASLAACAHRGGRVAREMRLPEAAPRHTVDERHQRFLMAVPIHDPMPAFPDDLPRPLRRQAAVCVGFVVTQEGDTVAIEPHAPAPDCPGAAGVEAAVHARLRGAVAAALADWRWFGAAVCSFPDGVEPDDDCRAEGAQVRAVPIRLDYRFVFEPDGRRVSMRR